MKKGMDIYHVETGGDMMAAMVGLEKHECYDVAASDTAVCADVLLLLAWAYPRNLI